MLTKPHDKPGLLSKAADTVKAVEGELWAARARLPEQFRDAAPGLKILAKTGDLDTALGHMQAARYEQACEAIRLAIAVPSRV